MLLSLLTGLLRAKRGAARQRGLTARAFGVRAAILVRPKNYLFTPSTRMVLLR